MPSANSNMGAAGLSFDRDSDERSGTGNTTRSTTLSRKIYETLTWDHSQHRNDCSRESYARWHIHRHVNEQSKVASQSAAIPSLARKFVGYVVHTSRRAI